VAALDYFLVHHIPRHDNWRASELAQQASWYNVSRGMFFISEQPMSCSSGIANVSVAGLIIESTDKW
jgi:hypothetical protein